jgi:UDPglucose--hexose-1-phosphate uridylyltransferase
MSQLRKDPVTKRWVIIVSRADRPWEAKVPAAAVRPPPRESCPFCPGAEGRTPPDILTIGGPAGWQVRVVSNKFPALKIEGSLNRAGVGLYDKMDGVGAHEVIIEHPSHDASFATYAPEDVHRILRAYRERSLDLRRDRRLRYLLVFKNSGRLAGATLAHAHSQLIATPVVPRRVMEELEGAAGYYDYKERCVYCDMLRQELATRSRLVFENDGFAVLTPFASRFPFELAVIPKAHGADFAELTDAGISDLSEALSTGIGRLLSALASPPFNYMIHTAPVNLPLPESFHWHIEIIPRLTGVAGFEWGSGFYVNPVAPEQAARTLREIGA